MYRHISQYFLRFALAASFLAGAAQALAQTRSYTATAPDGVTIAIEESGNPSGPPVILIHGLLGSRLDWQSQLQTPALSRYRLISYDLRGHGQSGKPSGFDAYHDGRRWADDLAAVIDASNARHAVLVGWSLGGVVISNYLAAYGDTNVAGAVYVDGVIELKPEQITAHPDVYRDMTATDLKTHLDGERRFLAMCFDREPDRATFERLLANAALASWDMQAAVPTMTVAAAQGLASMTKPVLLIYGEHDALVKPAPSIARVRALNPHVRVALYANSGHAPFIEEPQRFNRDLADFVERAQSVAANGAAGITAPSRYPSATSYTRAPTHRSAR